MNIFILGNTPDRAAESAVDAHLNKQILEIFQMLAVRYPDRLPKKDGEFYATTHESHPVTRWICNSAINANYALKYAVAFGIELNRRNMGLVWNSYPFGIADALITIDMNNRPFHTEPDMYPLCVPEYIRQGLFAKRYSESYELGETPKLVPDIDVAVEGYRLYYVLEKHRSMAKFEWSCKMPEWYLDMCVKLGRPPF